MRLKAINRPAPCLVTAATLLASACATAPPATAVGSASRSGAVPPPAAQSPETARLPAGPGRELLAQRCTGCHDLEGLRAYQGYYNADRWRAMIVTMVDHGAVLDAAEVDVLTGYLVEHFGPGTR